MLFMYILQTYYFNALRKRNRNFPYKAYRTLKDAVSKLKGNESDGTAKILKQWEKGIDTSGNTVKLYSFFIISSFKYLCYFIELLISLESQYIFLFSTPIDFNALDVLPT